ncbi:Similar to MND1: Meiotic nuclear division protein 1 homolog (Bos taurus) [Cotesia congregata]|uniref:Similar to MND1: Meiotic nuclear division protein 1 homolog (Bos taurus) n=1 Tax=Cotesia congregata TaxID=51543 RepID=A0A8J2MJ72_COTCN|nr:Similar to MND1: Meiotic nuclear division protein 1 homolog (Bos taurus) [Cotesia congregata]
MATKRVSLDEKRSRMLQLFYEKREFFTLKELEKIAPKEKGIVVQSVKDIVQALVDDGIVQSDKIGSAIYFWAFPGENITTIEKRIAETGKNILLKAKEAELKSQVAKFSEYDPEVIEQLSQKTEKYKEAANTWTDNIFAIQSWCKNKFDINTETLNKQFHEPNANNNLEEQAQYNHSQRKIMKRMVGVLHDIAKLIGVCGYQSEVHHTLGQSFLLLININVKHRTNN